eukprot:TRINITY_DN34066_c0_g1_i1.p2 TRINITY_DN34066_c0_g1~~TRINITY_DN34066_c0_g1_i1.p2  ORF type:complete len:258 (+),score=25.31 TRINITY_DN34066_c0_g1_i1:38-811(+)
MAYSVNLSVVLPAYNEEERLPPTLEQNWNYLNDRRKQNPAQTFEIIVVDDKSKDGTVKVVNDFMKTHDSVRLVPLPQNRGKGGAIKAGMEAANGKYALFADADNATEFKAVENLLAAIKKVEKDGKGVACGSRAHLQADAVATRTPLRNLLMHMFHFCVWVSFVLGIYHGPSVKDTQCGFKLFTHKSAKELFKKMHLERFAFDVELLMLAYRGSHPVTEVAVNWEEIEGSKVTLKSMVKMGLDLLWLIPMYGLHIWG